MNRTMRHLFLAMLFSILSAVGLWFIDFMEGSKIGTSEYFDISFIVVGFGGFFAFLFYFISFFVLDVIFERLLHHYFYGKLIIYAVTGGICGYYIFQQYEDRFVKEYSLHVETSIITFIFIGLLLVYTDKYLQHKKVDD